MPGPHLPNRQRKPVDWGTVTGSQALTQQPCSEWVTALKRRREGNHVTLSSGCWSIQGTVGRELMPGAGTWPPLPSVSPAANLRTSGICRPRHQTSSRVSFSSLRKGQQLEPPSLPCRDPGKVSRAICAKGCHAAPQPR